MAQNGVLTAPQARAVAAIMTTRTVTAAAEKAEVSLRTLTRWLADPAFAAALQAAEGDMLATTARAVLAIALQAVDTLKATLDDQEAGHGVKLRAADLVLGLAIKLTELRTLEARLTELESEVLRDSKR
jgi:phage terminase small subunit